MFAKKGTGIFCVVRNYANSFIRQFGRHIPPTTSQNKRMLWVGRDLTEHLVHKTCHGQGHFPLHQIAQNPAQSGLETSSLQVIYNFSGQPACFSPSHSKVVFPNSQTKPPLCQFEAIPSCPSMTCPCKKFLSSSLVHL